MNISCMLRHSLKPRTTGTSLKNEEYFYKTYSSFFKIVPAVQVVPRFRLCRMLLCILKVEKATTKYSVNVNFKNCSVKFELLGVRRKYFRCLPDSCGCVRCGIALNLHHKLYHACTNIPKYHNILEAFHLS